MPLVHEDHGGAAGKMPVVWITGLSGSGKSTLARAVAARLRAAGAPVILLDGDELRAVFGAEAARPANHGRAARLALAFRYARLCRLLAAQGVTVVIATISLFAEIHAWNRASIPGYVEVYLDVPLAELRARDPKGIYRRFDAGELSDVAGLDLAIDEPERADLVFRHDPSSSPATLADQVMRLISQRTSDEDRVGLHVAG